MKKEIWGFNGIVMRNFAGSGSGRDYVVDVRFKLVEFLKLFFVSKKLIHAQFTNFYLLMMLYLCGWRHNIVLT